MVFFYLQTLGKLQKASLASSRIAIDFVPLYSKLCKEGTKKVMLKGGRRGGNFSVTMKLTVNL